MCYEPTAAAQEICMVADDIYFDVCNKHAEEILTLLNTKERPKKAHSKKNTAKAA